MNYRPYLGDRTAAVRCGPRAALRATFGAGIPKPDRFAARSSVERCACRRAGLRRAVRDANAGDHPLHNCAERQAGFSSRRDGFPYWWHPTHDVRCPARLHRADAGCVGCTGCSRRPLYCAPALTIRLLPRDVQDWARRERRAQLNEIGPLELMIARARVKRDVIVRDALIVEIVLRLRARALCRLPARL